MSDQVNHPPHYATQIGVAKRLPDGGAFSHEITPIGPKEYIRVYFANGDYIDVKIDQGRLELDMVSRKLGGEFAVKVKASNRITVEPCGEQAREGE